MSLPALALPGQLLGPSSSYAPGPGTHLHASNIYASLSGRPTTTIHPPPLPIKNTLPGKPVLTIPRLPSASPSAELGPVGGRVSNTNALPRVGDVVVGKVVRCMVRQVNVAVMVVYTSGSGGEGEGVVCADDVQGVVRREDVRATEKDKVLVGEGFRVGDLVRAVVISLGDQSNYYLSTAGNELGVIMARSEDGNIMVPISWKEFRDPVTGETETRKVAKPL
ncbi:MAG: hypothetical protein Q9206_000688 [Seirophora lacunosa]|nr:MAG: hypothetical protein LQ344_003422 [Seirophora lacunosa]